MIDQVDDAVLHAANHQSIDDMDDQGRRLLGLGHRSTGEVPGPNRPGPATMAISGGVGVSDGGAGVSLETELAEPDATVRGIHFSMSRNRWVPDGDLSEDDSDHEEDDSWDALPGPRSFDDPIEYEYLLQRMRKCSALSL